MEKSTHLLARMTKTQLWRETSTPWHLCFEISPSTQTEDILVPRHTSPWAACSILWPKSLSHNILQEQQTAVPSSVAWTRPYSVTIPKTPRSLSWWTWRQMLQTDLCSDTRSTSRHAGRS